MTSECLLWDHAKTLAKDQHLRMHGECPVNSSCDGSFCIFISPLEDSLRLGSTQTEKFFSRLSKWEQKGLERLRRELGDMCQQDPIYDDHENGGRE